jgi:peptidoglycan/LPS O-acetylase OafA/YrhL
MEGRNINIPGHLASLATFTFNFAHLAMYPASIAIFIPLWSISHEEQFYSIIPGVLQQLSTLQEKTKWIIVVVFFLAGSVIRALFIHFQFPSQWIYFLPFTHFDSMLGGLVIGLGLFDRSSGKHQLQTLLLGILFISLIFMLPNMDVSGWGLMLTYPLIGCGMSLIVFSMIGTERFCFKQILANRLFLFLGKISYGLYIFHVSAFSLAALLLSKIRTLPQLGYPQDTFLVLIIGFLITVLFSIASYNLLEKPFLKIKERFGVISSHPI